MTRATGKIFTTGRSQAVRLPKEFRFDVNEVYIRKEGDELILSPKKPSWREYFEHGPRPTADFMRRREDQPLQDREEL